MFISGRGVLRARCALVLAALGASGCATFSQDVHLSPFFSNLSTADGGREIEALAGAVVVHRPKPDAPVDQWHLKPLWCRYIGAESAARMRLTHAAVEGEVYDHFLVPLGDRNVRPDESVTRLLPIFHYQTDRDVQGLPRWRLIALPGIMWSQDSTGRIVRAWFPFGGIIEDFGTYDRIDFWLFPLYLKTVRGSRVSYHFLWPIFNFVVFKESDKEGVEPNGTAHIEPTTTKKSKRVWPFYGESHMGGFDRYYVLWPFFHYQHDNIHADEDQQRRRWMFWPFIGHEWGGGYRAWTALWPFFGYSYDRSRGFWSFDGPWPFVRFQRPGTNKDVAYRSRVWPFYSYYEGDGLKSTWVAWPFFNQREEKYADGSRRAENVIPFWQHWEHFDLTEKRDGSWEKLWPLYQRYVDHDYSRTAFPALNPLWHTPEVDEHYAWIYELYTRTTEKGAVRERAWGGLWRRETGCGEEREYVSGLWSRRKWRDGEATVRETSLLFGLLRWRSRPGSSFEPMWPAFPGPGWPALRQG